MVRSPQLIVCAVVTTGSCAEVAVRVSERPVAARLPVRSTSVRRTVHDPPLSNAWQRDEPAAVAEVAAADPGPVARQVLQIEQKRPAVMTVDDGLQPAVGEHVQVRAAAVADKYLVATIVLRHQ